LVPEFQQVEPKPFPAVPGDALTGVHRD
jgi:hypothetical protein